MKPVKASRITCLGAVCTVLPSSLLRDAGLNFFVPEYLIVVAGFVAFGALLALFTWRIDWLFCLILASGIYCLVDAFLIGPFHLKWYTYLLLVCGIWVVLFLVRDRIIPIIAVFCVVFSAMAVTKEDPVLLDEMKVSGGISSEADRPDYSVLHIVLDEMMTPDPGLFPVPDEHPIRGLLARYQESGYDVYTRANTLNPETIRSLSLIAGLMEVEENVIFNEKGSLFSYSLVDNKLVKNFVRDGMEVYIIQANYLDFCGNGISLTCRTYSRYGLLSSFRDASLTERTKYALIALHQNFISDATANIELYKKAAYRIARALGYRTPSYSAFALPMSTMEIMQDLPEHVSKIQPGQAYFMHLLLPHFPFIFDADCTLLKISDWGYPVRYSAYENDRDHYKEYWDQVSCTQDVLFNALQKAEQKQFLKIIIHGDHGARITWNTESPNDADLMNTFLAIKNSDGQGSIVDEPTTMQQIVIDYYRNYIFQE